MVNIGFGKYPCDIDFDKFSDIGLSANLGQTFGLLAIVWSKTSFAFTLLRLVDGKIKALIWLIIISMNIAVCLEAMITWLQCDPVSRTWDPTVPGMCWQKDVINGYGIFISVYSGVMDIVLALLPWRLVWNLRMKKTEKFGVAVAMSMGLLAGMTAFIKASKVPTMGSNNFTYEGAGLVLWASAEIGTTIIGCCIPMLRALLYEAHKSQPCNPSNVWVAPPTPRVATQHSWNELDK
ncbi:hypothetical protein GQ53DRAFT_690401 [Thozetella sp. PMI_491]|nr:hypothetical protein GQ53DRAFT_690401 [Thozetella sp. PMI_491]